MICHTWADMDLPVRELEKPPHQRTNISEHIVTSKKGYEIFCVINWLLDKLCVNLQCLERLLNQNSAMGSKSDSEWPNNNSLYSTLLYTCAQTSSQSATFKK